VNAVPTNALPVVALVITGDAAAANVVAVAVFDEELLAPCALTERTR